MPLTDAQIKAIKPSDKLARYHDEKGLYLEVSPAGGRWWRFKYKRPSTGKENRLSLGTYPEVSLKEARLDRDQKRILIAQGIDPAEARKVETVAAAPVYTLKDLASDWYAVWKIGKDEDYVLKSWRRMEMHVFPDLGARDVNAIDSAMIIKTVSKVQAAGHYDLAHVLLNKLNQMYRFSLPRGLAKSNPAAVKPADVLVSPPTKNRPRVHQRKLPTLLKDIEEYQGKRITLLGLKLMTRTFVRTSELIQTPWEEIDGSAEWRIPPERMKRSCGVAVEHIVPLARQTQAILDELRDLTGAGHYVLPGENGGHMSNNTLLYALYRMGYRGQMTGHGFRGVASTILHEHGFDHEHIELQLAHVPRDEVAAAYNHAKYLKQRAKMMQWWADFLDDELAKALKST